jgi:hypothetical protein
VCVKHPVQRSDEGRSIVNPIDDPQHYVYRVNRPSPIFPADRSMAAHAATSR